MMKVFRGGLRLQEGSGLPLAAHRVGQLRFEQGGLRVEVEELHLFGLRISSEFGARPPDVLGFRGSNPCWPGAPASGPIAQGSELRRSRLNLLNLSCTTHSDQFRVARFLHAFAQNLPMFHQYLQS